MSRAEGPAAGTRTAPARHPASPEAVAAPPTSSVAKDQSLCCGGGSGCLSGTGYRGQRPSSDRRGRHGGFHRVSGKVMGL
jgi:hypothetical protein